MKRSGQLRRLTPLQSTRNGARRRSAAFTDPIGPTTRQVVSERSGGACEAAGCTRQAEHLHHRQLRRFGNHTPSNLLHLCHACHTLAHSSPLATQARSWGLLLRSGDDPSATPVWLRHGQVFLTDDGQVVPVNDSIWPVAR